MGATELRNGRYALVRTLGEGAQGETFEAVDKREGRLVAIKCFRIGKAKSWKDVELAEREARTLASLDHPLLPKYVEHFEHEGGLYLVMDRIEGESLHARRKAGVHASVDDVVRMLRDAADALAYLHGRAPPVVHRDIKPGNVIRRPDGSFAFVDFGSVRDRLRPEGGSTVTGTFGYMAPEQFQGRASPASDVYGVGATAIAMLTGQEPEELPHRGLGIDVAKAVPRNTPRELVRVLASMLEPNPDERAASVAEALRALPGNREPMRDSKRERRADVGRERDHGRERRHHGVARDRDDRRENKRARKAQRREARQRRRHLRNARTPFVPRLFAQLGLVVARIAVWMAVGVIAPAVLLMLSPFFPRPMQRASAACVRAAKRADAAIGRASGWLSGREDASEDDTEPDRVRVSDDATTPGVRVDPSAANAENDAEREAETWDERAAREAKRWTWPGPR